MSEEPIVQIDHVGPATVVTMLTPELLEDRVIIRLEDALISLAYEEPGRHLVLDFCNVRMLSSSLLGLLIRLKKMVTEQHGRLLVCCIRSEVTNTPHDKYVYELLKIVRLDSVFEICDSVPQALAKLGLA
jgi:anti-sigma B factor antagonist